MRRAGDVCFAQVFRDGSGKKLKIVLVLDFRLSDYLSLLLLGLHSEKNHMKFHLY